MNTGHLPRVVLIIAVAMEMLALASADAATMTSSTTAPTIDGQDIASYGTPTGQDKWWPDDTTSYGTPGKTVGQTFTTGSEGVRINAITFQVRDGTQPTKTYAIRVGMVSGTTFETVASESAIQDFATAGNDYWTWTLDTPVFLFPDTVYGVDVGLLTSSSSWETGIPYVHYTADVYPDGTRFRSGTEGYGIGDSSMTDRSGDRVFHLDLTAAEAPLLTLRVDVFTGEAAIVGYETQDTDINYYQIASEGNSLDVADWVSLADQDFDGGGPPSGLGDGWEEAGSARSGALAEAFLLGDSTIGAAQSVSLGKGYDTAVGAEDLVFTYRTDSGAIIERAAGAFTGAGGSTTRTWHDGDMDGDGDVDNADLGFIAGRFTGAMAGMTTVPEPATLFVTLVTALPLLKRRRSRS